MRHDNARISAFLTDLAASSPGTGLSEAKMLGSLDPGARVVIEDDGEIVAVGVAARHPHGDGTEHWAVETAVEPSLRFDEFETMTLRAAIGLVPPGRAHSVWSNRASLDRVLPGSGFAQTRRLDFMRMPLPAADPPADLRLKAFEPGDEARLVDVNAAAFRGHREAAGLDRPTLDALRGEPWWDPAGILFLVDPSGDADVGFCWTKVHPDDAGEIYRIGVVPGHHGSGCGRALTLAGFRYLHRQRGCRTGILWVDATNGPAVGLYRSIGMSVERSVSEWEPVDPS